MSLADYRLSLGEAVPRLCVSAIPSAGTLSKSEEAQWVIGLEAMQESDLTAAREALANQTHPAFKSALSVVGLLEQQPDVYPVLEELLTEAPEDACLHQVATVVAWSSGSLDLAHKHAATAYGNDPSDVDAAVMLGLVLLSQQSLPEAEAIYRAAYSLHPNNVTVAVALAGLLMQSGRPAEAIPYLKIGVEQGIPLEDAILEAYFHSDQRGPYLAYAGQSGIPLPTGVVGDDLWVAYRESMGLGDNTTLMAALDTDFGSIECELLYREAPITVGNFVSLAQGGRPWGDPSTVEPLYPGTIFHRVIPGFMIQGGDPDGLGTGGPGYQFIDEVWSGRSFDQPGLLAMANAGPGTNGSQFFVTEVPTQYLDGRHTIFGVCNAESLEVVRTIGALPTGEQDRPETDVVLRGVRVWSSP